MIEIKNNSVYVTTDKLYIIPLGNIGDAVYENDELLGSISMKELSEVFVYGIPYDFSKYLLKKVSLYDSSSSVNGFKFNGKEYWLDKSLRNSLFNLFNNADPEEEFEVVFGNIAIKNKAGVFKQFLLRLEKYAYGCFVATQKHLNNINNIVIPEKADEFDNYINFLIDYDFTSGYPEKLEL